MRTRPCHHTRLGVYVIGDRKGEPYRVQLYRVQLKRSLVSMHNGSHDRCVCSPSVQPHKALSGAREPLSYCRHQTTLVGGGKMLSPAARDSLAQDVSACPLHHYIEAKCTCNRIALACERGLCLRAQQLGKARQAARKVRVHLLILDHARTRRPEAPRHLLKCEYMLKPTPKCVWSVLVDCEEARQGCRHV